MAEDMDQLMKLDTVLYTQSQPICRSHAEFDAMQDGDDPIQRMSEAVYRQLEEEELR